MKKIIFSLIFVFTANLAIAQDLVIFNSTDQELQALYLQDTSIDAEPKDLLQGKKLAHKAGVKLSLNGNLSKMDLAVKKNDGRVQVWESQDLSKAQRINIDKDFQLVFE